MKQCPPVQSACSHKCNDISIKLRPDSRWRICQGKCHLQSRWPGSLSGPQPVVFIMGLKKLHVAHRYWKFLFFFWTQALKSFLPCNPYCMVMVLKFGVLHPPPWPDFLDVFILLNWQVYRCLVSNIFVYVTHIPPRISVISIIMRTLKWLRNSGVPPGRNATCQTRVISPGAGPVKPPGRGSLSQECALWKQSNILPHSLALFSSQYLI